MANFPRIGTKTRALFDLLSDGKEHRWKECSDVYSRPTLSANWQSNPNYVSLGMGPVLKKYADRIERGVYRIKREFYQPVIDQRVISRADHLTGKEPMTISIKDVEEGAMPALVRKMVSASRCDPAVKEAVVEMAKTYNDAQDLLQQAAMNFTDCEIELRKLLKIVREGMA